MPHRSLFPHPALPATMPPPVPAAVTRGPAHGGRRAEAPTRVPPRSGKDHTPGRAAPRARGPQLAGAKPSRSPHTAAKRQGITPPGAERLGSGCPGSGVRCPASGVRHPGRSPGGPRACCEAAENTLAHATPRRTNTFERAAGPGLGAKPRAARLLPRSGRNRASRRAARRARAAYARDAPPARRPGAAPAGAVPPRREPPRGGSVSCGPGPRRPRPGRSEEPSPGRGRDAAGTRRRPSSRGPAAPDAAASA